MKKQGEKAGVGVGGVWLIWVLYSQCALEEWLAVPIGGQGSQPTACACHLLQGLCQLLSTPLPKVTPFPGWPTSGD